MVESQGQDESRNEMHLHKLRMSNIQFHSESYAKISYNFKM